MSTLMMIRRQGPTFGLNLGINVDSLSQCPEIKVSIVCSYLINVGRLFLFTVFYLEHLGAPSVYSAIELQERRERRESQQHPCKRHRDAPIGIAPKSNSEQS